MRKRGFIFIKFGTKQHGENMQTGRQSLTNILVVNGHKHVNDSLNSKEAQTEEDQKLEEDVAPGPHVRNKQADLLPKPLPCRLVLTGSAQKALREREKVLQFETHTQKKQNKEPQMVERRRLRLATVPVRSPRPAHLHLSGACTVSVATLGPSGQ